jgi:predicted component of type VI protein secretion system
MPRLRIDTGKQAGKSYDVTKPAIIGRGETAQVQITDTHASREHCKVFEQAGAWVVADLNSRNGIKVNGVQTTRKTLSHGDKIAIGETTIVFETTPAAAGAAKPAAAGAPSAREEAFAAARAASSSTATAKRPAAATAAHAGGGADSGLKVSDHVLQFHKVDVNKATLLDIDLAQSPGMSRFLIWIACLAFLGLVVWLVSKMVA